jgi:CRISPR/Cas system-associated exonuclease Cas4 (RecB family)
MRPINASDVGSYLYCARAWWYRKQGVKGENLAALESGETFHRQYGRKVVVSGMMRLAGWAVLLIAILLIVISLTQLILR